MLRWTNFLIAFFIGCSSLCKNHSFQNNQWNYADSLQFSFQIPQKQRYKIVLKAQLDENYPYRNLYVLLRTISQEQKLQSSLLNFVFVDSLGYWQIPQRFWGSSTYVFEQPIGFVQFSTPQKVQFRLIQFMRDDSLKGIKQIQLCLVPVE